MKYLTSIFLLFIAFSSHANIHGVNIGISCEEAWTSEENSGSFISSEKIAGKKVYEGVVYNKNAYIIYGCKNNKIVEQTIMVKAEPLEVAQYTIESFKNILSNKFGKSPSAPDNDLINALIKKGITPELASLLVGYSWETSTNTYTSLSLQAEEGNLFYVVISQ